MSAQPDTAPIATSPAGTYRGVGMPDVEAFTGIRYAEPPTGERRWRDPVPAALSGAEVDATRF